MDVLGAPPQTSAAKNDRWTTWWILRNVVSEADGHARLGRALGSLESSVPSLSCPSVRVSSLSSTTCGSHTHACMHAQAEVRCVFPRASPIMASGEAHQQVTVWWSPWVGVCPVRHPGLLQGHLCVRQSWMLGMRPIAVSTAFACVLPDVVTQHHTRPSLRWNTCPLHSLWPAPLCKACPRHAHSLMMPL